MSKIISELLKGKKGLEIGKSAWNDFHLDAKNVDIPNRKVWEDYSRKLGLSPAPVDYEADAASIPVEDSSQDFVFSSHMLEHHPNPIAVLIEWFRVIKNDGLIVAIIPKRDASPNDIGRPLTTLSEFIDRWKNPHLYSNFDPAAHQTVWDTKTFDNLIQYGNEQKLWNYIKELILESDDQVGNGFLVFYRVKKGDN